MKDLNVVANQNFNFEGSTYPASFAEKWIAAVEFLRTTRKGWLLDKGVAKVER